MIKKVMLVEDAIGFLGFPYENIEFDSYLTSVGISERPSWNDSPVAACANAQSGFVFIFGSKSSYVKYYGAAVDGGELIFEKIQIYSSNNSSELSEYRQVIPFDLTFKMSFIKVKEILGEPNMDQPSGPNNIIYSWFNYRKIAISICFLPAEQGISHISISKTKLKYL
jgi:hypothetical protein